VVGDAVLLVAAAALQVARLDVVAVGVARRQAHHHLRAGVAPIVSLSVDPPPVAAAFRAGLGARWTFLCDPDRTALERLGLRETTDTVHDPYVPRTFSLFPDLRVHREYDGYWFWSRPTVDELVFDLREISAAVRPDWEAPTP